MHVTQLLIKRLIQDVAKNSVGKFNSQYHTGQSNKKKIITKQTDIVSPVHTQSDSTSIKPIIVNHCLWIQKRLIDNNPKVKQIIDSQISYITQ